MWKTRHQNPPIDWGVGEGGRYVCGLALLIFTTATVFRWFLQTYLTSGHCSCWFLLVMKLCFFWHYLGFQVMAILCWAAKNSLRGTATIFVPRNGIPSWFLFRWMVWNRIPSASILFHGTEFRVVFSSAEWFGTEFREFPIPRNSRNSAGTNQLFRLFRNNFFGRKLPTPLLRDTGSG